MGPSVTHLTNAIKEHGPINEKDLWDNVLEPEGFRSKEFMRKILRALYRNRIVVAKPAEDGTKHKLHFQEEKDWQPQN
eukprot:JP441524.1.p1 GENE.JP441524.1~~JP441524.1.p1  ORF type:complete len:89 (-),score=7.09 JP441524.1:39-272(-)